MIHKWFLNMEEEEGTLLYFLAHLLPIKWMRDATRRDSTSECGHTALLELHGSPSIKQISV